MRPMVWLCLVAALAGSASTVDARDRSIKELPKDVWDMTFVWTEPFKQMSKQMSKHDPVNGLWLGLLDGSIQSVGRTARFLLPGRRDAETPTPEPGKQFRYSF